MPFQDRPHALAVLAFALLLPGCRSLPPAGTGDVAFRLVWSGVSDLDLHVVDPSGERYWYGHPRGASGGVLDVDCNAGSDRLCARPIENVFWPVGAAPPGRYRVWAVVHALIPAETPLEALLLVLEGDRIVDQAAGRFGAGGDVLGPFDVLYSESRSVSAFRPAVGPLQPRSFRCEDGFVFALFDTPDGVTVLIEGVEIDTRPTPGPDAPILVGEELVVFLDPGGARLTRGADTHVGCRPSLPATPPAQP